MSVVESAKALCASALALASVAVLVGCSRETYPVNPPLARYDPAYGFRLENVAAGTDNARDMLLVLTFSGGGTRAAALAYGTLEALRDTPVRTGGTEHSMLKEVDYISATSGGAVTAAYYGLYRDQIFADFGDKFLYRDVQGELIRSLARNVYAVSSPRYGRGDVFAEYLDRNLFGGMTFAELARHPRPFIALNATDISLGAQFVFSQHYFDLICSDLNAVSVGRAVAASAAALPVFSPITLWNYAGKCGYTLPPFLTDSVEGNPRRARDRMEILTYLDSQERPYIHLMDGGMTDNLAVRQALAVVTRLGSIKSALDALGFGDVRYVVFVTVDAELEANFELDKSAAVPGPIDTIGSMKRLVGFSSFDASVGMQYAINEWQRELQSVRKPGQPPPEFFVIDVALHSIKDPATHRRLTSIPTTLNLARADVDELRGLAGKLLRESPDFQRLMTHIGPSADKTVR